jgi:hypothetical protein
VTVAPRLPLALRTSFGLQDIAAKTTTLSTGTNTLELTAAPLGKVRLSGTVRDALGRPAVATVMVRQVVAGAGVVSRATSATDGTWSLEVWSGPPGWVRAERAGATSPEVEVPTDGARTVALVLPTVKGYTIQPSLVRVSLDGSRSRVTMDWTAVNRYDLWIAAAASGVRPCRAPTSTSRSALRCPSAPTVARAVPLAAASRP